MTDGAHSSNSTGGQRHLAAIGLGLCGTILQTVELESTLVLRLSDVHFIAISSPLSIDVDGEIVRLSPEDDSEGCFEPIRRLVGRSVVAATVDPAGALDVVFEGGARFHIEPDPAYEAWNVSGPDGALVVSQPGGELAVWTATPGADG